MIVIDNDVFNRLKSGIDREAGTSSELDKEMKKIMDSNQIDSEKWKSYQQVLQRYLHFTQNERKPVNIPIINNVGDETGEPGNNEDVLEIIPKSLQKKAKILLHKLSGSDLISWDHYGTVTIKGEKLHSTNITDLVNETVRPRKQAEAHEWQQFVDVLKKLNIPLELIGNVMYRDILKSRDNRVDTSTSNYNTLKEEPQTKIPEPSPKNNRNTSHSKYPKRQKHIWESYPFN